MGKRAGFTLIELLVVIGIIVLLAGIVMPNFMKYIDKAKKVRARADIHSLENALAMYQTDYGTYPETLLIATLETMFQAVGTDGKGPYLSKDIPNDPYGTAYSYAYEGSLNPLVAKGYDLWSWGKDKNNDNGADGSDDITSWSTETD